MRGQRHRQKAGLVRSLIIEETLLLDMAKVADKLKKFKFKIFLLFAKNKHRASLSIWTTDAGRVGPKPH